MAFFRCLDDIFFYKYRKLEIKKPIFIIGNPRSGTSFLYDLLALDDKRFFQPLLYQSLFCSITLLKLIDFLIKIDLKLNSPMKRFVFWFNSKFFRYQSMHKIRLDESEEDEAISFLSLLTSSVYLICPFIDEMDYLSIIDKMPFKVKKRWARYYKNSIKRMMYVYGGDKRYLCKNVLFTGKIKLIKEIFSDAKIIYPIRNPYKNIPSVVGFYSSAWKTHSPEFIGDSKESRLIAWHVIDLYKHFDKLKDKNIDVVFFRDLIKKPKEIGRSVFRNIGLNVDKSLNMKLDKYIELLEKNYKTKRKCSLMDYGLTKKEIYNQLTDIFRKYGFKK